MGNSTNTVISSGGSQYYNYLFLTRLVFTNFATYLKSKYLKFENLEHATYMSDALYITHPTASKL